MRTTLPRIITVLIVNTILVYVLSIAAFLAAFAIAGSDPREAGLIMISPLAFMVLGMVFVAGTAGIIHGILINAFWNRFIDEVVEIVKYNIVFGASVSLLFFAASFFQEFSSGQRSASDTAKAFALFLTAAAIFALSNILTVFIAKKLFHHNVVD